MREWWNYGFLNSSQNCILIHLAHHWILLHVRHALHSCSRLPTLVLVSAISSNSRLLFIYNFLTILKLVIWLLSRGFIFLSCVTFLCWLELLIFMRVANFAVLLSYTILGDGASVLLIFIHCFILLCRSLKLSILNILWIYFILHMQYWN